MSKFLRAVLMLMVRSRRCVRNVNPGLRVVCVLSVRLATTLMAINAGSVILMDVRSVISKVV